MRITNTAVMLFCMLHMLAHTACFPAINDSISFAGPSRDQGAEAAVFIKGKENAEGNGEEITGDNEGDDDAATENQQIDIVKPKKKQKKKQKKEKATPSPYPPFLSNANAEFYDPNWTPFPNMVGSMRGYNILEGNPLQDSSDPGFVSQLFIPVDFNDKYGRMALQGGITANDLSTCKRSLTSESVTNMKGLKELTESNTKSGYDFQVGTDIEVSGKYKGVEISTTIPPPFQQAWGKSKVLKELEKLFEEDEEMVTISTGHCEKYAVLLDPSMLPPFTDMLKNGLVELSEANNKNKNVQEPAFKKFIEAYGTHYMIEVKMGAQIATTTEFSRTARDTLDKETLENCNYKIGAKLFGIQIEENNNGCSTEDEKKLTNIGKENYKITITSKGSRPTDLGEWATQDFDPVPLKFKLAPIINLFRDSLFEGNNIQKKDQSGQTIAPKDILQWFGPIYWQEKEFCRVMQIECTEHTGCGITDSCPADTFCDHTADKNEKQFCTSWTPWRCNAECGRGYLETRTRRCNGCIGSTYQEKSKMCKAERGCYTGKLHLKKNLVAGNVPTIILNAIPDRIEEKLSLCALFKMNERNSLDMVIVHVKKDKETVIKLMMNSDDQFIVFLADMNDQAGVLFENFPKEMQWQHVCVVWRHDWSIYGELTLYLNGLFFEKRTVLVNRVSSKERDLTTFHLDKPTPVTPLVPEVASVDAIAEPETPSSAPIKGFIIIGAERSDTSQSSSGLLHSFVGYISGVTIYNRVLTATNARDAYEGFAPKGGEIFTWSQLMNAKMNSKNGKVEVISENINPADAVRTEEDGDYYFENDDAVGRDVAEQACEQRGGFLVPVDTPGDNERLKKKMKKLKVDKFWIGLKSKDGTGLDWQWSDERKLDLVKTSSGWSHWSNWDTSVNFGNMQLKTCVSMGSDGKWHPEKCDSRLPYACLLNEVLLEFKSAEQSEDAAGGIYKAENAIDRNNGTVAVTKVGYEPQWTGELVKPAIISRVHMVHYGQQDETPASYYEIKLSKDGTTYSTCTGESKHFSFHESEIKTECREHYKKIRIEIKNEHKTPLSALFLNEVYVYGRAPADEILFPNPTYGVSNASDGEPYTQGYVEVRHNEVYGTICDTDFDDDAATVLCIMMGFSYGKYAEAFKQEGLAIKRNKPVLLDNVKCNASPKNIAACEHSGWGIHDNCRAGKRPHKRDVGIRCFKKPDKKIRLHNTIPGNDDTGRYVQGVVEFKDNLHNQWSSICYELNPVYKNEAEFHRRTANALCRILGYESGIKKKKASPTHITMTNRREIATVECAANGRLEDCTIDWDSSKCSEEVEEIHLRCYIK